MEYKKYNINGQSLNKLYYILTCGTNFMNIFKHNFMSLWRLLKMQSEKSRDPFDGARHVQIAFSEGCFYKLCQSTKKKKEMIS